MPRTRGDARGAD
uniref:Uncharacterized protein n=1 Tax=Leersia perrieri TaxID=77586 RepID=A0A0D9XC90_9ORYZ